MAARKDGGTEGEERVGGGGGGGGGSARQTEAAFAIIYSHP